LITSAPDKPGCVLVGSVAAGAAAGDDRSAAAATPGRLDRYAKGMVFVSLRPSARGADQILDSIKRAKPKATVFTDY
jgi:hypothetical protein